MISPAFTARIVLHFIIIGQGKISLRPFSGLVTLTYLVLILIFCLFSFFLSFINDLVIGLLELMMLGKLRMKMTMKQPRVAGPYYAIYFLTTASL